MFQVYLLKKDEEIVYIGQTQDLDQRLRKHSRGSYTTPKKSYTDCVCWRSYETRHEAVREEARLLRAFRRKFGRFPQYNREDPSKEDRRRVEHPVGYKALVDAVFRRNGGGQVNGERKSEATG